MKDILKKRPKGLRDLTSPKYQGIVFFYSSKAFEPLNSPKVVLYFCQLIPKTSEKICLDIFDVETIFRGDAETRMGRMM